MLASVAWSNYNYCLYSAIIVLAIEFLLDGLNESYFLLVYHKVSLLIVTLFSWHKNSLKGLSVHWEILQLKQSGVVSSLLSVLPTSQVFTSGYVNTETILHFFYKITNERGTKTVFTYAHVKWFYGQSERTYYLNYFIKSISISKYILISHQMVRAKDTGIV